MFVVALHADLAEEWKRQAVFRVTERFDLCIRPRLLLSKVVRREGRDLKTLLPLLLVHLFKVGILRRVAAEACRVDQQQYFATELTQ
jgi:hypothetical protein